MLYHEVTASSLIKVDMQGNIVEAGSTNFGVSVAGFMLHSAIHAARPDIKCIIHLHHPAVVAVSVWWCGGVVELVRLFRVLFILCSIIYPRQAEAD